MCRSSYHKMNKNLQLQCRTITNTFGAGISNEYQFYWVRLLLLCFNRDGEDAELLKLLAENYSNTKEWEKAVSNLHKSLAIDMNDKNFKNVATTLEKIADYYLLKNDKKLALEYYHDALTVYEEIPNSTYFHCALHRKIGGIYHKNGEDILLAQSKPDSIVPDIDQMNNEQRKISLRFFSIAMKHYSYALNTLNDTVAEIMKKNEDDDCLFNFMQEYTPLYYQMGIIYTLIKEYPLAIRHYMYAQKFIKNNDEISKTEIWDNMFCSNMNDSNKKFGFLFESDSDDQKPQNTQNVPVKFS